MIQAYQSAIEELKSGQKPYQKRARIALPILVRQALARNKIYYSDLAKEMDMPNPRNLNYVLGCIGEAISQLSDQWRDEVPPIQCLVINRHTKLPGEGVGWFAKKMNDFASLNQEQQREIFETELYRVFYYQRWWQVLDEFNLKPLSFNFKDSIDNARRFKGNGESENHRELKEFVAKNPSCIELPINTNVGKTEYPLPSGDLLDVSFFAQSSWVAAEVKSSISSEADIVRGLYQCVKYEAVMKAVEISQNKKSTGRAVLVLGGSMPASLVPLKNLLGITVFEEVGG